MTSNDPVTRAELEDALDKLHFEMIKRDQDVKKWGLFIAFVLMAAIIFVQATERAPGADRHHGAATNTSVAWQPGERR